jgi:WD repeat-containing protein 48
LLTEYDEESTAALLDGVEGEGEDAQFGGGRESSHASFRQCIGNHTDWIHEVLLCNNNQTVVSASSDGNVNIWNPHDSVHSALPQVLGTHKDYVKALTQAPEANWIASGSFDKTIKLWDVGELRHEPLLTIQESEVVSSVYSLSSNGAGTLIAGGSPEQVVRLWDPRSGHQVSQLVGHSDTVRKVLLSEDGAHLLSASSDATIRLWSVGEQRCLHTFTHHAESVWALHSDHPRLDVFYSGDRAGLLCKVDWERCNEVSEGECVLLGRGDSVTSDSGKFTSENSSYGITSIASTDNRHVWTANANGTVDRWQDVASRTSREALYPLASSPPASSRRSRVELGEEGFSSPNPRVSALRGDAYPTPSLAIAAGQRDAEIQADTVNGMYGIPFDSLVCLAPPNDPYGAAIGLGSVSMRAGSKAQLSFHALSGNESLISLTSQARLPGSSSSTIPIDMASQSPNTLHQQLEHQAAVSAGSPATPTLANTGAGSLIRPSSVRSGSIRFAPADTRHEYDALDGEELGKEGEDASLEARLAFEERDLAVDAKPLNDKPDDIIRCRRGLVRCTLLNDRRHCLTVDSDGTICLWDIVTGSCLGAYLWDDMLRAARTDGLTGDITPGEALDVIKERVQGHGAAPIWCTVDTRIGLLSVHLEYPRCFDAEIYVDEFEEWRQWTSEASADDQRLNIGRLLCKSLFAGFAEREKALRVGDVPRLPLGRLALELRGNAQADNLTPFKAASSSGNSFGMRIPTSILPKSPAILPVQTPLLHVSTQHLSDLQKLVSSQTLATPASERRSAGHQNDYFSLQKTPDGPGSRGATTPRAGVGNGRGDLGPNTPGIASPTSPGGGKLMGRLRLGLRREGTTSRKQGPKTPGGPQSAKGQNGEEVGTPEMPATEAERQLQAVRNLLTHFVLGQKQLAKGGANPTDSGTVRSIASSDRAVLAFSPKTELIIAESTHDSGAYQVRYRGIVGQTQDDVAELEVQAPMWLLEHVLDVEIDSTGPALGQRDKDKLTFLLIPWEGQQGGHAEMSNSQHESVGPAGAALSASQELQRLPPVPTGTSRLTATRMLRIKKACAYIADKLRLIEQQQDGDEGPANNMSSGYSSIAPSRRASLAPGVDQTATSNGGATVVQARTPLQQQIDQHRTIGAGPQHLRRPSAMSVSSYIAAGLNTAPMHVMPPGSTPSDYIEILCRDEIMPPNVTLTQIQRYTWKSGSPIKLEYRWKAGLLRAD